MGETNPMALHDSWPSFGGNSGFHVRPVAAVRGGAAAAPPASSTARGAARRVRGGRSCRCVCSPGGMMVPPWKHRKTIGKSVVCAMWCPQTIASWCRTLISIGLIYDLWMIDICSFHEIINQQPNHGTVYLPNVGFNEGMNGGFNEAKWDFMGLEAHVW